MHEGELEAWDPSRVEVGDGAWNMARDEAALEAAAQGGGPVAVRLYRWSRPTISLGRNQPAQVVDAAACARAGVEVVRRPTGGRALLHGDDLTYALVLPPGHPAAAVGVDESHRRIAEVLQGALAGCGVEVELGARGPGPRARPDRAGPCFEEHLGESLCVGTRKLCGSAQARRRGALLQHGSLPVSPDLDLQADLLLPTVEPEEARRRMRGAVIGLAEAAGGSFSEEQVRALARRIGRDLDAWAAQG